MKILAIVPARGGSKRLPGKNKRLLGGKPLIVWSIDAVNGLPEICDTLVSTDDPEIAAIAREAGALVPWLRPAEISSDTATTVDAARHAMSWFQAERGELDGVLVLQPTSPFRSRQTLMRGIELFSMDSRPSVIGMCPARSHPMWCFRIKEGLLHPFMKHDDQSLRSQDLPDAYVINGAFYLLSPAALLNCGRNFAFAGSVPLIFDRPEESLDIDTEFDWEIADNWLRRHEQDA